MTSTMRKKRGLKLKVVPETDSSKKPNIRRETFITVPSSQLHHVEEEEAADIRTPNRLDCAYSEENQAQVIDAPLLQSNGKLPLWFRKLQGQGGASSGLQSEACPRQVRSRWTEQLNPLTICSNFSPSPSKSQEEEEEDEEDFHPQSLESVLGVEEEEDEEEEESEVLQSAGEKWTGYILYPNTTTDREFEVEGEPQLEVRGQGPVWRTRLSPDSACSEVSAGSLEQQHDADTDSLSQGSSVGSLGLEEDEDRSSLKNHFDTLASSLSEEKFDTDLRSLQPVEDKNFLNPRLSISTRFLSRFQDRLRGWQSRAPPPVSIPPRILEESNVCSTLINSESSIEASTTEVTLKEKSSSGSCDDVTCRALMAHNSSMAPTVQQGPPRLGYLGTTASSRAKLFHDTPTPTQEEEKENVSSLDQQPPAPLLSVGLDLYSNKSDAHQDQTSSVTLSPQTSQNHTAAVTPQVWATPTEEGVSGRSISSVDETPTNQNLTLILSPNPTTTPTTCDIISVLSDITCATTTKEECPGGSETRIQTDPVFVTSVGADSSSFAPPSSSSSPLHPCQTGSADEDLSSLQQCEQVADELRRAAKRAIHLYQQLTKSSDATERRLQMSSVLQEALDDVNSELQSVLRGDGWGRNSSLTCGLEDDTITSLLEKYSDLLVQMTQNKLKLL